MLQRIQTVFLIAIVILMVATLFIPLWAYKVDNENMMSLFAFYFQDNSSPETAKIYFPYTIVATLAIASATVALIEITKFKNRLTQIKLGALNSLFMAGTCILGFYFAGDLMKAKEVAGAYGPGLFLPAIAMLCNMIANRFIRKDEKLVKSVDRIR